ncbi:carbohydrate ABC transporter permease [Paenibacillus sacheonensis]|uniref:ABC transporter permease subunit n=1 Tax=Paenibacillus sacheonensis TaxID=742054 RepID=A0A7X4YPM7_9BACL|nr:carbohydrate ABC transporter permease [Paenibacillus sacheonensis]MBM7564975.1 raffinose/stachyose/melibiose transport system permease protein [Paenibacillus sacheonensis]NBC70237.1 ABC transporter permease subunit [Paenibacillus sacheonensis]
MGLNKRPSILLEIVLILVALSFLFPVFFLVESSFKEPRYFFKPFALPHSFYLDYYKKALHDMDFFRGLWNTVLVMVGALALAIMVASMAGYVLSRRTERLFRYAYLFFLSGMVIPTVGSLIPLFTLAVKLHLMNTRILLVLIYTAGFIPFASFLYAAFTKAIPRELEESASLDGCGPLRLFFRIIFPLLLPATGTFIVTNVYGIWNDFLTPLIFLNQPEKMTLMPQIVQFMFNKQSVNYGPVFAVSVLAVLPLVVLFAFTQKYMLRGLTAGAVKG